MAKSKIDLAKEIQVTIDHCEALLKMNPNDDLRLIKEELEELIRTGRTAGRKI